MNRPIAMEEMKTVSQKTDFLAIMTYGLTINFFSDFFCHIGYFRILSRVPYTIH